MRNGNADGRTGTCKGGKHRRSQGGALGARAPPGAEKKIWGPNLQGKAVSAPPGRECITRQSKSGFF